MASLVNREMILVDLSQMHDETIKKHLRAAIMESALKHVKNSSLESTFMVSVEMLKMLMENGYLTDSESREILSNLLSFLADNVKKIPEDEVIDELLVQAQEALPVATGEILMTLRERFEQRIAEAALQAAQQGVEQGMEQGMQRGMQRVLKEIVLSMVKNGCSDEQICLYTQLSPTKLNSLKRELEW